MSGRFLVIGECGQDTFHHCRVNRLAPDIPIPVALPYATTYSPGMAANVAANLVSLGATEVQTMLSEPLIKTRYVDEASGYIMLRVDGAQDEDGEWKADGDRIIEPFSPMVRLPLHANLYSAIVISDYAKGYLSEESIEQIAQWGADFDVPTFLDTKKLLGDWSKQCIVKINEREYQAQVRELGANPERFCRDLVVTFGARGSKYFVGGDAAGKVNELHVEVEPIEVSSLSGAGDSYHAAFALMMVKTGGDIATSMDYANRAARIAVSKRGVVAVRAEEIQ